MKKFYGIIPLALMAVLASAADTPGQPNPQAPDNRDQSAQQADAPKKKEETLSYRQRMVTGKVTDVKEVDVTAEGKTENHFLAKITTYTERIVVVDLGPRSGVRNEIKAGDEIAAFGITGRLNQRPLIVASKVALIVPIEGREEIYESLPVGYDQNENANSNQRFSQEALQQHSNATATANQSDNRPQSSNVPPFLRSECGCR